jgi:hypothetical protein
MIGVHFDSTDKLILNIIEAKIDEVGLAVKEELDEQDALTAGYIVANELHGQILKQRSGKLAGSVRMIPAAQEGSSVVGRVEAAGGPAWYGRLFEEGGTGPFDIVPKNAKALRFESGGEVVFAKIVHHPGVPSKPFMGPALEARTPEIVAGIEEAIGAVLAK